MHWFKPSLRNSIWALLGGGASAEPVSTLLQSASLDDIRQRMLMLAGQAGGSDSVHVVRRIRYASDIEALWFIRSELMALLASVHGEAAALEEIDAISELFDDLLPDGLRSRPSPLGPAARDQGGSR